MITEAERIYRDYDPDAIYEADDEMFCVSDYEPIISHIGGEILARVDSEDYTGNTLLLYRSRATEDYGVLTFGWGSCTVCDALQGCESWTEVQGLLDFLRDSIRWDSAENTIDYLETHDWEADWIDDELVKLFVPAAILAIEERELEV